MVLKWIIILLAFILFSFMAIDGSRALIIGDYFRPETGEYAEQLGPWSKVVKVININPESDFMKWTFAIWGSIGLILMVSFAMDVINGDKALLLFSALSLWYLMIGTLLGILTCLFLLIHIYQKRKRSNKPLITS